MPPSYPQQPSTDSKSTRPAPWRWPALIAHRGGGILAPENTLAAFRIGLSKGFTMMEYDVKLSADGIPVLLHDDSIDRTSSGNGAAADMDLATLLQYDFGAWHSPEYAGEPIPTLYSIAAYTRANGLCSNIEIKPCPGQETKTGFAVATTARELWKGALVPPLISSFSEASLAAARKAAPELPRALLIAEEVPEDWGARVRRLGCIGLNLNHKVLTQERLHEITSAGYSVVAWTVNDLARARQLLSWGCHAVVTDYIDSITPSSVLSACDGT